jgi:hypothetical protein
MPKLKPEIITGANRRVRNLWLAWKESLVEASMDDETIWQLSDRNSNMYVSLVYRRECLRDPLLDALSKAHDHWLAVTQQSLQIGNDELLDEVDAAHDAVMAALDALGW